MKCAADRNHALDVRYTLRAFTRALAVVAGPSNLTTAEFRLLRTLGEGGGATQAELAAAAAMDRPYVSTLVRRMTERRLIQQQRNATDRRRIDIVLMPDGQTLLDRLSLQLAEVNREAVAGIDPAQLSVFTAVMARIQANLDRYNGGRTA